MCGIAGLLRLDPNAPPVMPAELVVMNDLLAHRGPDAEGLWLSDDHNVGLAHRRLEVIDLSPAARQPMAGPSNAQIVFNGEIYNYLELRSELERERPFRSHSDTEVILAAYEQWGVRCLSRLRGMFAFAIWDPRSNTLFAARDRFGIKPFYYARFDKRLIFASEIKALLPFASHISTNPQALAEYLTFQFPIGEETLFAGVQMLNPGEYLEVAPGAEPVVRRYWDVHFQADLDHTPSYFSQRLRELVDESIRLHLRADVPIGSYLSGGIDSSLVATLASRFDGKNNKAFHGKFSRHPGFDESRYAQIAARAAGKELYETDITSADFVANIEDVIYHLDYPVAGPGSFPQFMVSRLAADHVKVVLGGQGGDEVFAGYARYLIAYFEQCLKAAIDGTYLDGTFVVTAESIIPNLGVLQEYKPLLQMFWAQGLFEDLDERYFRLIDRSTDFGGEVEIDPAAARTVKEKYRAIFNNERNVHNRAYLDRMCHFDLKSLIPALLHVEDRMSMAHGLESRVPFLDHPLIEFLATVPATVKFRDGNLKVMLKEAFRDVIPADVTERRDKMGFPVPLNDWYQGELYEFVRDIFNSQPARERGLMNVDSVIASLDKEPRFSRKTWGLLNLELWHRRFHDQAAGFRSQLRSIGADSETLRSRNSGVEQKISTF